MNVDFEGYSYSFKGVIQFNIRAFYLSQYYLFLCFCVFSPSDFYSAAAGVVATVS